MPARSTVRDQGTTIDNTYNARHLLVLEGLEAVRKRPGMYIGSTDTRGLMHCVWEIIDNGVDEALAGAAHRIEVTLHADGSVEVHDDGRGIPVDKEPKTGLPGCRGDLHQAARRREVRRRLVRRHGRPARRRRLGRQRALRAPRRRRRARARRSRACRSSAATRACSTATARPRRSPPQSGLTRKGARVKKGVTGTRIRFWPDRQIFTKDATLQLRRAGHPGPADVVHRPGPRAGDPRPARRRAGRGDVPARRRHRRVLRLPRLRRAGQRDPAARGRATSSPRPSRCSTTPAT